ncbi:MAG: GTP-binding protein [Candidatus Helarchaeota archaeon]|nr:GTP-binding protein [Candidatus Helarchaeota archaeon]
MSNVRFRFKLVLIGEGAVGKTSIRQKYMGKGFTGEYLKTIGADFASKVVEMTDSKSEGIKSIFQIWDLAGQQEFKEVRASFYGGCQGVLLVFDLTRKETMDKLKDWILEAAKNAGGTIKAFALIGNKCDLPERIISEQEGLEFAKYLAERLKFPMPYIETSAKTGENIEYLFSNLCRSLLVKEGFEIAEVAKPTKGAAAIPPAAPIEKPAEVPEIPAPGEASGVSEPPVIPEPPTEAPPKEPAIALPKTSSEEIPIPDIPGPYSKSDEELATRVSELEKRVAQLEEILKKIGQLAKNIS